MATLTNLACAIIIALTVAISAALRLSQGSAWRLAKDNSLIRTFLGGITGLALLWLSLNGAYLLAPSVALQYLGNAQRWYSLLAWMLVGWFSFLLVALHRTLRSQRVTP